jgi:3-phosphoshikimate 1-carboxyvinyltransferase
VAATIVPNSKLLLNNVGINPTRTGIIDVLLKMGAKITCRNQRWSGKEPVADLYVESAELKGVSIEPEIIPRLVDEIPIITVAAMFAQGRTVIRGAEELRVKETDRLKAISSEFTKMGASIKETNDGLIIEGPQVLNSAVCNSHADHRMAMALSIAGLASKGIEITDCECVSISYPDFFEILHSLAQ